MVVSSIGEMRRLKMYNATRSVVVETRNKGREARDTMANVAPLLPLAKWSMNFGRVALERLSEAGAPLNVRASCKATVTAAELWALIGPRSPAKPRWPIK